MNIGIELNENNQVMAYFFDYESGIRVNIDVETLKGIDEGYLYKYENGEFIRDYERENQIKIFSDIEDLKQKLSETDYVVTKSMEYQAQGLPIPEDCQKIMGDRQSWRDRINTLEEML